MSQIFNPATYRFFARLHLWLGFAVGLQVLIWLVSGVFMVLFPIEQVRGEHLRAPIVEQDLQWPEQALTLQHILNAPSAEIYSARAEYILDRAVWRLETREGPKLIDAISGADLATLDEAFIRRIALARYAGSGELISLSLVDTPPREAFLDKPAWHAEFGPDDPASFWINGQTGDVRAVRTWLWRAFDFAWGLHIMDWHTRENFNSWWIKMTSIIALIFALAGSILAGLRIARMVRRTS
ncbi:MAG: hypothetical protein GYB36_03590 [Alphaproteobacteria bacterium]|nr:hypothetical protein [Alphaproteobacteria bacterium]